jgi:ankyrin repeat protein
MTKATGDLNLDRLLLRAVRHQDLATVQQQLAAGANASAATSDGLTALHLAAAAADGPLVESLIGAGADVSAVVCPEGKSLERSKGTPLEYMVKQIGRPCSRRVILHSAGGVVPQPHKCKPRCSQLAAVVQQLVAAGAEVNVGHGTNTPIHYAASLGCPTLVGSLLQAGAKAGRVPMMGYTPLHEAACSGSEEVMQQLLGALGSSAAAALVNTLGREHDHVIMSCPLHLAAAGGHLEVAEALVAAGADREEEDGEGLTPMHRALFWGHCHLVPLLVTPGNVNMHWRCDSAAQCGDTLLQQAVTKPWQHGTDSEHQQWRDQLAAAAAKAVTALLAAGADAGVKDQDGSTTLATAAAEGHPEVLQVLLEHELQRRRRQQQQPQAVSSTQLFPALLQELSARALRAGNVPTWRVLLTTAAEVLGEEGVRALWASLKRPLLDQQPGAADQKASTLSPADRKSLLSAWMDCWEAACRDLETRQWRVTRRLRQLVHRRHHLEQLRHAQARRAIKRARLAHELQLIQEQQQQRVAPDSTSAAAGSSRATPGDTRHTTAAASGMTGLEAAAGFEQGVRATLEQLRDRSKGLAAAAAGAAGAGHWGLCMDLLRELVHPVVSPGDGRGKSLRQAVHVVQGAVSKKILLKQQQGGDGCNAEEEEKEEEVVWEARLLKLSALKQEVEQQERRAQLQAALQVCDVFLADWLAMRQQQAQEVREDVVAAVEAAGASNRPGRPVSAPGSLSHWA